MTGLLLALRVALSLAAVLGLLWWLARRMQSGAASRRREGMALLSRQQLGRRSGVALLEVGGRRLAVGYGEEGVTLLHDLGEAPSEEPAIAQPDGDADGDAPGDAGEDATVYDFATAHADALAHASLDEATLPETPGALGGPARLAPARKADATRHRSPLDGSILAPDTWRKAVVAMQDRTLRRQ